jgi:dynein heavy chain, axonemal
MKLTNVRTYKALTQSIVFGLCHQLMNGTNLLMALTSFPKDTINAETVELMTPYFEQEDYNLETATHACGNVAGLCSWTKSMAIFYGINREVLPLKVSPSYRLSAFFD